MSVKACYSKEANEDAERLIHSTSYILSQQGNTMRPIEKDFILTQYMLTNVADPGLLTVDCNVAKPKYEI